MDLQGREATGRDRTAKRRTESERGSDAMTITPNDWMT
jgi:hypothetical protein